MRHNTISEMLATVNQLVSEKDYANALHITKQILKLMDVEQDEVERTRRNQKWALTELTSLRTNGL